MSRYAVSTPEQAVERDADGLAARALRGESLRSVSRDAALGPASAAARWPASVTHALAGPGRPLEPAVRDDMEGRFGCDFGGVRLHDDARAAQSARDVAAQAYTRGAHIVFGAGRHAPHTAAGRTLLAHELAHVVQSQASSSTGASAAPLLRVTDEELDARHEWNQKSPEERQRILASGPTYREVKDAAYQALIDSSGASREAAVATLRARAGALPAAAQGPAGHLVDVVADALQVISDMLFFDLGAAIGFTEGIVGMAIGLVKLVAAIVALAVHYVLAIFGDLDPLADDLDAMATAWHDLGYLHLDDIVGPWIETFQAAPQERKAAMIGECVGQVGAFIATWESSSAALAKWVPPPGAAPQMALAAVGAGAKGGTMAVPMEMAQAGFNPNVGGAGLAAVGASLSASASGKGGGGGPGGGAPITPADKVAALSPAAQAQRARLEAKVSSSHSASSGYMQDALLQSEHLYPQSAIDTDPLAITSGLTPANSPTIWIDEALHRAGLTYGAGLQAIFELKSPLQMLDAAIADYVALLDTPEFAYLDKDKYVQGFAEMRDRYVSEYPEVFAPGRTDFSIDPLDTETP